MQTYVATGFDDNLFRYGISWIASLKELAKYDGKIIVVGFDLSNKNKDKVLSTGVRLIEEPPSDNIKRITYDHIIKIASEEDAVFAYWDAVVYFQKNITHVLQLAEKKFAACSSGFLAGPSKYWTILKDLKNIASFLNIDCEYHAILLQHFSSLVQEVESSWNYYEPARLKDKAGVLCFRGEPVHVIHVHNEIEKFVATKNILFWERHKKVFEHYMGLKRHSTFKLLAGQQSNSSLDNV